MSNSLKKRLRNNLLSMAIVVVTLFAIDVHGESNWTGFRGVEKAGVAESKQLPERWSETEHVMWSRPIPGRGWSSPVVWGDKVFLTTVVNEGETEEAKKGLYFGGERKGKPEHVHTWWVYCLDLNSSEVHWKEQVHKGIPARKLHIKNSYATETPVTDGERVYFYFGNVGLYCYTLDGDRVWSKKFEPVKTRYGWGTAASPVLHDEQIYIVNDNDEQSYLLALNKRSGEHIWKINRDEKSNWSTPYIWKNKLRTEIVTPGSGKFRSYDTDGQLLYEFGGGSSITIATPYAKDGLLYVSSGYVGDRERPVFAVKPGASGDISLKRNETSNDYIAWCQKQGAPYNPTTLVYDGLMYVLYDRGIIACYDAKTGEVVYGKQRLPNGRAFTTSPWAYDGRIYCLNEYGETFVIKAGREYELLHTNKLGDNEMCMSTPAIAGDKLLIRGKEKLYCISKTKHEALEEKGAKGNTGEQYAWETKGIQRLTYGFVEAKRDMEYMLFVPSTYNPEKKYPLMVALHGLGSSPQQIIHYPGLMQQAEKHGYIVVAPWGYNSRGWYGSRGKGGGRYGDPKNLGELSEKDVMNVLGLVREQLNVDEKRIYLMGHSMGGGGALHLGIKYGDIWAGLAPIAPAIYTSPDALKKITHMPVIVVQGDNDRLVPVGIARKWVGEMKELEMTHEYVEVKGGGHVIIAFTNMPRIFEFFNKQVKK